MFGNIYKGKKILVTGHTGFKGSWLVAWLQMLGANVSGIALEPNTDPAHFKLLNPYMESHIADIRDAEKTKQLIAKMQPEMVFHLAAQPLVRESYEFPLETLTTNVMGTANVLQACRNVDALRGIVVVTSDKCYENKEWYWGYRESDPMGGHDPYSASKGCTELVTSCFRNSFFNLEKFGKEHQVLLASARAGNVIGGGDWAKDRLIPDIIRAVTTNKKVQIRSPKATRPWQHVLECLSGYLRLGEKLLGAEKEFASGWNFAPNFSGEAKVIDILVRMQKCWSKVQYEIIQQQGQPHEAHLLKLDSSKAMAKLQWQNVWDLDQTINVTTDWYRDFYEDNKVQTLEDIKKYCEDAKKISLFS
jgi:CDP-glucose 4,6-dehydratase